MNIIDKNQVDDIKSTVVEKVDEYKKEINQKTKIDRFRLIFDIGTEKHRTGGYTDEEYNDFLDKLADSAGFNMTMFKNK